MTMIVRVKDKQFTVNDTLPLGAGATAFVYPAAVDGDVRQYVAKVGRPGLPPKDLALFYGELDILDSLRAAYPPGSETPVVWAARGEVIGQPDPPPCIVMERADDEHLLSRFVAEPEAEVDRENILRRERRAVAAARQYAGLLAIMADKKIITRRDRKAADFRWLRSGNGDAGRLIVLDWNRAAVIDTQAADAATEEVRQMRQRELEQGQLGDIRFFAKYWAEFLLDREVRGALPEINDPDSRWQALTRGLRLILRSAAAAGLAAGYQSAQQLANALEQHAKDLDTPVDRLMADLNQLSHADVPDAQAMLRLIDLAQRKGGDTPRLRELATQAHSAADSLLRQVGEDIKKWQQEYVAFSRLADVEPLVQDRLRALPERTADAARLLLLRWRVAAQIAAADPQNGDLTISRTLVTAVQRLAELADRPSDASALDADAALRRVEDLLGPTSRGRLEPLQREANVRLAHRAARSGDVLAEWRALQRLDHEYAAALRLASPDLDLTLSNAATGDSDASATAQRAELDAAYEALFANREVSSPISGVSRAAVVGLRDRLDPLLKDFHRAYNEYTAAARRTDPDAATRRDHVLWLDQLLSAAGRPFPAAAARAAANWPLPPPPGLDPAAWGAALRDEVRRQVVALLNRQAPCWPDEVRAAAEAVSAALEAETDPARRTELEGLQKRVAQEQEILKGLRQKLGWTASDDDAGRFVPRLLGDPSNPSLEPDPLDEALRDAAEELLEVRERPALPQEMAADLREAALEGRRVRTLVALRAARLLPARMRLLADQLAEYHDPLSPRDQEKLDAVADLAAEPAKVAPLFDYLGQLRRMQGELEGNIVKLKMADSDVTASRTALEQQLQALKTTDGLVADSARPLGRRFFVAAFARAERLELAEARANLKTAQLYLQGAADEDEKHGLNAFDAALTEMEGWQKENSSPWRRLQALRAALDKADAGAAHAAWGGLKGDDIDWNGNLILEQFAMMLPAAPADAVRPVKADPVADLSVRDQTNSATPQHDPSLGPTMTLATLPLPSNPNEPKIDFAEILRRWDAAIDSWQKTLRPPSEWTELMRATSDLAKRRNSLTPSQRGQLGVKLARVLPMLPEGQEKRIIGGLNQILK